MAEGLIVFFGCFAAIMLIFVSRHIAKLRKRAAAISRLERKIDLLLNNAGLEYDPYADIPHEVAKAIHSGNKTLAVKLYRDATGADLIEAKEFIAEAERRSKPGA